MAKSSINNKASLDALENEVTEVTALLRDNVEKVLERGERIDILQSRSDDLESSSSDFRASSVKLRKKMWWRNCKIGVVLGLILLTFMTIFIVLIVEFKPWDVPVKKHNGTHMIGIQTNRKPVVVFWP